MHDLVASIEPPYVPYIWVMVTPLKLENEPWSGDVEGLGICQCSSPNLNQSKMVVTLSFYLDFLALFRVLEYA